MFFRYLDSYGTPASTQYEPHETEISDLDLSTLRLKRKRTTQRKDTYSPRHNTSDRRLGQCLVINPTKASSPTLLTESNPKLKHNKRFVPQFSSRKEKRRIQNGLHASVPNGSCIPEPSHRTTRGYVYKFTSIDSYLKFNECGKQEISPVKIPVRVPVSIDVSATMIGQRSTGGDNHRPERNVRPKHQREVYCSMPSARYSDITDLDKLFVVTTPHMDQKSSTSLKSGRSNKSNATDTATDDTSEKLLTNGNRKAMDKDL